MTKLTSRERLRRCYFHEELDRPGVYIRTNWPENDPTYDDVKAFVEANTDLKRAIWLEGSLEETWPTTVTREPHSEDFAKVTTMLHTPKGDLRQVTLVGLRKLPGFCQEHFVKNVEDAEKWLSLPLPKPAGDASVFFKADKEVGDRGIADGYIGNNPGGHVADLFGSEAFAMYSVMERELVHMMLARHQQIMLNRIKRALSLGIGPYFSTLGHEMIVPPLHGPADFAEFCAKYDQAIYDLIHEAGGRIHVHCHSKVAQVFQYFVDGGVDVLHPFEPPPMGDITAKEAKRLARGKMTLEGNIQIAHMYEHTPAEVADEARQLIADAFDDHAGLIVCPTASLYQIGKGAECLEQVKAMVRVVHECTS